MHAPPFGHAVLHAALSFAGAALSTHGLAQAAAHDNSAFFAESFDSLLVALVCSASTVLPSAKTASRASAHITNKECLFKGISSEIVTVNLYLSMGPREFMAAATDQMRSTFVAILSCIARGGGVSGVRETAPATVTVRNVIVAHACKSGLTVIARLGPSATSGGASIR